LKYGETFKSSGKKLGTGFDVFIKRHGKLQGLGVSLTRQQAGLLARKKLKETLAATAFVKASGRAAKKSNIAYAGKTLGEFRQYKIKKGRKIFDPSMYIQKAKFRLGTRAEKAEIQAAKIKSEFFKKKKGGGLFDF